MNVNRVDNTNFQARVPEGLARALKTEAVESGSVALQGLMTQLSKVEQWGGRNSELTLYLDLNAEKSVLGMFNQSLSKMYGGSLPQSKSGSLMDTFMSLSKKDILDAEADIANEVQIARNALLLKAIGNPQLKLKIAGRADIDNSQLNAYISKLPEEKVADLRFNLDKPSKFSDIPPLNFVV